MTPSVTCGDGNGGEAEPELREAVAIPGIDPAVAFLVPHESPSTIFFPPGLRTDRNCPQRWSTFCPPRLGDP